MDQRTLARTGVHVSPLCQLGAAEVQLDSALLDRIDEIAAPGTNINPTDAGWTTPALTARARRR